VIEEVAEKKQAPIIFTNKKISTNLLGTFQEKNAALAYEIAKYLKIDDKKIIS
jgi:UDP-N-acetylmuramyl pentapeptide synthase